MYGYHNNGLLGFTKGELGWMVIINENSSVTHLSGPTEDQIREAVRRCGIRFEDEDVVIDNILDRRPDVYGFVLDVKKFKESRGTQEVP